VRVENCWAEGEASWLRQQASLAASQLLAGKLLAQQAITTANNVAHDAKRQSFQTRMTNLEQKVAAAKQHGTGYYKVNDLAKLLGEMNALRNVFGVVGIFIWAFATTTNTMVSNLIGQNLQGRVIHAINKIVTLSFTFTLVIVTLLNIFPQQFLNMFGQNIEFVKEATPVIRIISIAMLGMSISTVWLNAVTGTGKTKMNLLIEATAVFFYIIYIYLVMIKWKLSLAMAWTNEFVYWAVIFGMAYWFIKSGRWKISGE
jgi:hypothetical protein